MKRFAYSLAILAVVAVHAPAGAEIQMATSEMNNADAQSAGREFADLKKFAHENAQLHDGVIGNGSTKKVGSLKVDKLIAGPRTPAAIGKAIGGHANDGAAR